MLISPKPGFLLAAPIIAFWAVTASARTARVSNAPATALLPDAAQASVGKPQGAAPPTPSAAAPAAATDQPAPNQTDAEIVVMARKRAEVLTKIPETIQAISAGTISRAGIRSLDDLGRQVPNVLLNRRQDNEPNVVIRGVGSFGNVQGVGFYVDDVQNFTDQSAAIEDVERIEILKGPQGTLYGGSDVGGAIKYVLKKPMDKLGGEAYADYGSFDTSDLYGAVNVPIVDGHLAVRLSGYWNHLGGFVPNLLIGGKADRFNEQGGRLAVSWNPTSNLDVEFSFRHSEVKDGGNIYSRSSNPSQYVRFVEYNLAAVNDRVVDGGILQMQYTPGPVTVTSITSYTSRSNTFDWDVDYSRIPASEATSAGRHHTPVLTQELRLASNTGGKFDWLVGLYYSDVENQIQTINANLYLGAPPKQRIILNYNNGKTDLAQYAAFVTANYRLGKFRFGGGLRVNRAEFNGQILNTPIVDKSVNRTSLLPKFSVAFDLDPETMIYANVAVGEEPGKVNVLAGTGDSYRNENALSFEGGIKGQLFARTLTYDLSGFYIDYTHRQFETVYINGDNVLTKQIQNIGRSVDYGFEGSVTYRPVSPLTLTAAAGYLDARWQNATFNLVRVDGLDVPFSPKFSFNTSVDYRQPIGRDIEVGLRGDYTHTSAFYWDVPNQAKQPGYDVLNLRASISHPLKGWELAVRLENTLNAQYYTTYGYNAAPAIPGLDRSIGSPSMPRRVVGSISYKF